MPSPEDIEQILNDIKERNNVRLKEIVANDDKHREETLAMLDRIQAEGTFKDDPNWKDIDASMRSTQAKITTLNEKFKSAIKDYAFDQTMKEIIK